MTVSAPGLETLPHAVFLRRMTGATRPTSLEAHLGRAAFVALRLVDLLGPERDTFPPDAFHYQKVATARACRGLPSNKPETSHLLGLVESAGSAFQARDNGLIVPGLFAYGHFLEDEMRLEEALDVLETLDRVCFEALRPADQIASCLRSARVFRKLNRFDDAESTYKAGGTLAIAVGDRHSELLSRIGLGIAATGRGNLHEAESVLMATLVDAQCQRDDAAEALAHQALAVVLSTGGRITEAIPHTWRAYQLYEDDPSRLGVLGDLGVMLLSVGDASAAEQALVNVLARGAPRGVEDNALIELMHCASYRRDQIGFERWRERCEARRGDMPPNVLVDYLLKLGVGRARFGAYRRAQAAMTRALSLAKDAGLHEAVFRIERILSGIPACKQCCAAALEPEAGPECRTQAIREVSASLSELGRSPSASADGAS